VKKVSPLIPEIIRASGNPRHAGYFPVTRRVGAFAR
jgi:hypothetical protein